MFKQSIYFLLFISILFGCSDKNNQTGEETAIEHAAKHLDIQYVCPMHPQIIRDAPGNCPLCGMTLVKKEVPIPTKPIPTENKTTPEITVQEKTPIVVVSSTMMQNMGMRTAPVIKGTMHRTIQTVGYIAYDENSIVHVHPRAEGWIEKLNVRAEGDAIESGQVLLELYSPEILSAQVDFLVAAHLEKNLSSTKQNSARNRLRLLEIPESIIQQIERDGKSLNTIPLLSPQKGTITRLNIREGMYVMPSMEMFTIADLSTIWVLVEVFELQLNWVKVGLEAEIQVPAYPSRVWKGKVEYLYPELEPKTRTLKVRLRFSNPDNLLRPNMFAQVIIHNEPKKNVLKIPREALIITGKRQTVITALDNGRFQAVEVTAGMQYENEIEVLSGLREGDQVVVSGQFLIDSEANLQASFSRFNKGNSEHSSH